MRVLVEPGGKANPVGKTQTHELDAVGADPVATGHGSRLSRRRASIGEKLGQRIPHKHIPHAQRRQRNSLRAVRIQAKQPGPNQAI